MIKRVSDGPDGGENSNIVWSKDCGEKELEVAGMKMLSFTLGVMRVDRIRNDYIRGTAHVRCFGDKVREARLRWFGRVQRTDSEYIGRLEPPGRRPRGQPKGDLWM